VKRLLAPALLLAAAACGIRDRAPGQPAAGSQPVAPSKILDFDSLYSENCAGCHGLSGKGDAAMGLADPVYLAIADDATIARITAAGVSGTAMPPFAQKFGGTLTDEQVAAIVRGMRSRWAKADALEGANPPPYAATQPGDPQRGAVVYGVFCASCHGKDGSGGARASSVVDPSYLELVSDQGLRTAIIVGRPDLGAPDWRGDVPGKPMTPQDISDVVAWLAARRPGFGRTPNLSALRITGGAQ